MRYNGCCSLGVAINSGLGSLFARCAAPPCHHCLWTEVFRMSLEYYPGGEAKYLHVRVAERPGDLKTYALMLRFGVHRQYHLHELSTHHGSVSFELNIQ